MEKYVFQLDVMDVTGIIEKKAVIPAYGVTW